MTFYGTLTLLTHFNVLLIIIIIVVKKHNMNLPSEPFLSGQYNHVDYIHTVLCSDLLFILQKS